MYREERLGSADEEALDYTSSMGEDGWIFEADLWVDRAHVVMLEEQGLIGSEEAAEVIEALDTVEREGFDSLEGEDVHEAIETRVIELVGDAGGRMHTARSRNDEVATCIRIAARQSILMLLKELLDARERLLEKAREHKETVFAAYTHLQRGQPTTLGHHLSAHERRLARETERLLDAYSRVDRSPLGACASASTLLDIDRERTAELLGFESVIENSMDAVSTRDFAGETVACCASVMGELSRISEELVVWSSEEFGLAELDDEFSTTSSVMPQKKNPDVAELARGRTGTVQGHLSALHGITKGLPMSYNRDLQELTKHLSEPLRITRESLRVVSRAVETADFREPELEPEVSATDLAEALVEKGMPFREAHGVIGELSSGGFDAEEAVEELSEWLSRDEVEAALDPERSVRRRGAGGPGSTEELLDTAEEELEQDRERLRGLEEKIRGARRELDEELSRFERG